MLPADTASVIAALQQSLADGQALLAQTEPPAAATEIEPAAAATQVDPAAKRANLVKGLWAWLSRGG